MNKSPVIIEESNISIAWYKTVKTVIDHSGMEITPLVLSLTGFEETKEVRRVLDLSLSVSHKNLVTTVAETIFPDSLYKFCDEDRFQLYEEYKNNITRIKKIDTRNSAGTYFERLISYDKNERVNQLEIIILSLIEIDGVRRSKLQASIFDPRLDHTEARYQGFPCLQHVTFYRSDNGGIVLNSFYAIQYLYQKAYGNWLGLVNLGKFIAQETGTRLDRVNCFVGVEHLDFTKKEAKKLLNRIDANLT